jgi:F-type H+-transporting ATPase subunit b
MVSVDFTFFVQWVNFGVLLLVLYFILYRPLVKFLDQRNAKVRADIEAAQKGREEITQAGATYQEKLDQLKADATRHLELAKKKAIEERNAILEGAHHEAERIILGGREEMKAQAQQTKKELLEELSGLVIDCTEQVLGREVKESDHKKMINDFIEEETKHA